MWTGFALKSDGDAGLFKVGCRYYDPQLGAFTSRDSYLDQMPYLYCEHDPINAVDPSGHQGGGHRDPRIPSNYTGGGWVLTKQGWLWVSDVVGVVMVIGAVFSGVPEATPAAIIIKRKLIGWAIGGGIGVGIGIQGGGDDPGGPLFKEVPLYK